MARPYKPDNIPGLMPYIIVDDMDEAISFYEKVFGFKLSDKPIEENGETVHAELTYLDIQIMLGKQGAWGSGKMTPKATSVECPIGLFIYVEDVETFFAHAKEHGAEVLDAPEDMFWGDRMCRLRDPFGYDWSFATNLRDFDTQ